MDILLFQYYMPPASHHFSLEMQDKATFGIRETSQLLFYLKFLLGDRGQFTMYHFLPHLAIGTSLEIWQLDSKASTDFPGALLPQVLVHPKLRQTQIEKPKLLSQTGQIHPCLACGSSFGPETGFRWFLNLGVTSSSTALTKLQIKKLLQLKTGGGQGAPYSVSAQSSGSKCHHHRRLVSGIKLILQGHVFKPKILWKMNKRVEFHYIPCF